MIGIQYTEVIQTLENAIENQEKRGQQTVVRNQILPKKVNHMEMLGILQNGIDDNMSYEEQLEKKTKNNIEYTKQQYEKMGIFIVGEYDDLFYNVQLPNGWKIKAKDHSMWNDLFDDKDRKRASFFYKAAFYDRRASINFKTRFHVCVEHTADDKEDYEVWSKSDFIGRVKDGEIVIFETDTVKCCGDHLEDDKTKTELKEKLVTYMREHYPNYEDINAYWE